MNDCSNKGICNNGTCQCNKHWANEDCSRETCKNNCYSNGICITSKIQNGLNEEKCDCKESIYIKIIKDYYGEYCQHKKCLNKCINGKCNDITGVCQCEENWVGEQCNVKICPNNCNYNVYLIYL